jgi:hypothetical protein
MAKLDYCCHVYSASANKLLGYYWHVPSVSTNNVFDILMLDSIDFPKNTVQSTGQKFKD